MSDTAPRRGRPPKTVAPTSDKLSREETIRLECLKLASQRLMTLQMADSSERIIGLAEDYSAFVMGR